MAITVTFTGISGFGTGSNSVPKLRVLLFSSAAAPASQTGGKASSSTAYQAAITVAATGSYVVGSVLAGPSTTSFTAAANTTVLDNIQDSTAGNNVRHGSFISTAKTASTGSQTFGSTTAFASDGVVVVSEIKASGTLARDSGNEPAVVSSTSANSVTTASFSPSSGDVVVALADGLCSGGTISDSSGLTWTTQETLGTDGFAGIYIAQISGAVTQTATASRSITANRTVTGLTLHMASSSQAVTATRTVTGVTLHMAQSARAVTATTSAAALVIHLASASRAVTATRSSAPFDQNFISATEGFTAARTATAAKLWTAGSAPSFTASRTVAGLVLHMAQATQTFTASRSAAALTLHMAQASRTVTAAATGAGLTLHMATVSQPVTATLSAAAARIRGISATAGFTATRSASPAATLKPVTASLTATLARSVVASDTAGGTKAISAMVTWTAAPSGTGTSIKMSGGTIEPVIAMATGAALIKHFVANSTMVIDTEAAHTLTIRPDASTRAVTGTITGTGMSIKPAGVSRVFTATVSASAMTIKTTTAHVSAIAARSSAPLEIHMLSAVRSAVLARAVTAKTFKFVSAARPETATATASLTSNLLILQAHRTASFTTVAHGNVIADILTFSVIKAFTASPAAVAKGARPGHPVPVSGIFSSTVNSKTIHIAHAHLHVAAALDPDNQLSSLHISLGKVVGWNITAHASARAGIEWNIGEGAQTLRRLMAENGKIYMGGGGSG